MHTSISYTKRFHLLVLCLILLASGLEVYSWYLLPHDWTALNSVKGVVAWGLFTGALLAGFLIIVLSLFTPSLLQNMARVAPPRPWIRWPVAIAFQLVFTWIFLSSPWALDFPGPWTRYLIAVAFSAVIALLLDGLREGLSWREIVLGLAFLLYTGSVAEIRIYYLTGLASRLAIVLEGLVVLGITYIEYSEAGVDFWKRLLDWLSSMGRARGYLLAVTLLSLILFRILVGPSFYWANVSLRFALMGVLSGVAIILLEPKPDRSVSAERVMVGAGLILLIAVTINNLYNVSNYPFSLTWSEGNRFYDYSMIFGQGIYEAARPIVNPYTYNAPGRFVLWGFPFLFSGLPIWFHRLWGSFLSIVPPLLFAWIVSRPIKDTHLRYALTLWIGLIFIVLAPVYAPILLSAIIIVLSTFDSSLLKRVLFLIIASIYASLSRWTWFLAPAAWAVLADLLLYYPGRNTSFFRRVLPTAVLGLSGVAAGYLVGKNSLASYGASESLTASQPLLWYRLFPNQTFSAGIILGTLIVTGPLLLILIWWMTSRLWKLDWLQILAIWGTLAGFLGAGLVVSTKIGGGGDLHNLDMYLITLTLVFALGMYVLWKQGDFRITTWPFWVQGLLVWSLLMFVMPFTPFAGPSAPPTLDLPASSQVELTLATVRSQVAKSGLSGQVLFMDQRQLLTFGYLSNIPLIPDYEKKYMMDQALASNAKYFQKYYFDLSNKRFSLIVTEPLKHVLKSQDTGAFANENDAWVKWVSDPTLCFYKPIFTDPSDRVELLIPRPAPIGCSQYLAGG